MFIEPNRTKQYICQLCEIWSNVVRKDHARNFASEDIEKTYNMWKSTLN